MLADLERLYERSKANEEKEKQKQLEENKAAGKTDDSNKKDT